MQPRTPPRSVRQHCGPSSLLCSGCDRTQRKTHPPTRLQDSDTRGDVNKETLYNVGLKRVLPLSFNSLRINETPCLIQSRLCFKMYHISKISNHGSC